MAARMSGLMMIVYDMAGPQGAPGAFQRTRQSHFGMTSLASTSEAGQRQRQEVEDESRAQTEKWDQRGKLISPSQTQSLPDWRLSSTAEKGGEKERERRRSSWRGERGVRYMSVGVCGVLVYLPPG
ncbi:hypothetical protein KUCAC02_004857, partial [Chaenocephalus aceratus]